MTMSDGSGGKGREAGFSLVEVTITLGIAVFALITMVALFQSLFGWSRGISDKREALVAMEALGPFLNDTNTVGFSNAYQLVGASGADLVFVRYRADVDGKPSTNGTFFRMVWMTNPAAATTPSVADIEKARAGRWIKARISVSTNNPVNPLPAYSAYTNVRLVLQVNFHALADPNQATNANNFVMTSHQTVLR